MENTILSHFKNQRAVGVHTISTRQISELAQISIYQPRYSLLKLENKGLIGRVKSGKVIIWKLVTDIQSPEFCDESRPAREESD